MGNSVYFVPNWVFPCVPWEFWICVRGLSNFLRFRIVCRPVRDRSHSSHGEASLRNRNSCVSLVYPINSLNSLTWSLLLVVGGGDIGTSLLFCVILRSYFIIVIMFSLSNELTRKKKNKKKLRSFLPIKFHLHPHHFHPTFSLRPGIFLPQKNG